MARYRVVFVPPGESSVSVDFIDSPTMREAMQAIRARYPEGTSTEIVSIGIDKRDPLPALPPGPVVVLEALARATLRCNTILLALRQQPVFRAALTPMQLASLDDITTEAQRALDLAQAAGIEVKP